MYSPSGVGGHQAETLIIPSNKTNILFLMLKIAQETKIIK